MPSQHVLRPVDIPVALHLAIRPRRPYKDLARDLHISPSTAHQSVERLTFAGLARKSAAAGPTVNIAALLEFLAHGVRYAFPAKRERRQRGVPTAHAGPALQHELDAGIDPVVWPAPQGTVVGAAVAPLMPSAPELPERCPELYELLTLVDAIRVGTARDREAAERMLAERLKDAAA